MRESDKTDAIGAALALLAGKLGNPPKRSSARIPTKKGGEFSYAYLNLPDLLAAIRPHLKECGLAVLQGHGDAPGGVNVYTRVIHLSGQWIEAGPLFVPATPGDPKSTGSASTYGCRYALCAMLGIAGEEDDDGARASVDVEPRTVTPPSKGAEADGSVRGPGMAEAEGSSEALRMGKAQQATEQGEGDGHGSDPGGPTPSSALTEYLKQLRSGKGGARRSLHQAQQLYADITALGELTEDQAAMVLAAIKEEDVDAAADA